MSQPGPVISIRNLTKVYRMGEIEVNALAGVDLDVFPGEMASIMGPSGSGKSTLMNLLGCLDIPTSGSYFLDGMDVSSLSDDELAEVRNKKIGFVFQSFNLLSRTTALANVELPLIYAGAPNRRERAMDALARVGLAERVHHKPNELSGGQQQRVAIARALVNNPAILLADEPTGNLDSSSTMEIMSIFQELNLRDGITVIFITHERDVAECTKRVVHIRDGRVSHEETVDQNIVAMVRQLAPSGDRRD